MPFGIPFSGASAKAIAACSLRHNHLDVFVEARSGEMCHKWANDGKWDEGGVLDGWHHFDE